MTDPLAPFRRRNNVPLPVEPPPTPPGYVAFGGKDRVERLKIHFAKGMTHAPGYLYLRDVSSDGEHGTNCVLMFDFMVILVRGKNLQPMVTALRLGTADFIQEFNSDLWPQPADDSPLIEAIEIVSQDEKLFGALPKNSSSS